MRKYRIHGDNIIECERIIKIIIDTIKPNKISKKLVSPSVINVRLENCRFLDDNISFVEFELLPGFNKNSKKRWENNIFDTLKEAGSIFDETPDVLIAEVYENETEKILLGIEFCSALQAGNQAWQRSGRAFSTGRTGCPYLYIVDFVKYELENTTRTRKNLRFPNAAVPYSYINYSKNTGNFVAQLYVKSEEFDKNKDSVIRNFDNNNFGHVELGNYIVKLLFGLNTDKEQQIILDKSMNVAKFIAQNSKPDTNFTQNEWQEIYESDNLNIVEFSIKKNKFNFHKTIAAKSCHGKLKQIINIIDKLSMEWLQRICLSELFQNKTGKNLPNV